jgi:hypothetical protein
LQHGAENGFIAHIAETVVAGDEDGLGFSHALGFLTLGKNDYNRWK